MEPAPKGDDFLELWKWYSKVRALIGSMQTQAVMAKRSPRSMYSQGVLTFLLFTLITFSANPSHSMLRNENYF